jgi:hypothetical protein
LENFEKVLLMTCSSCEYCTVAALQAIFEAWNQSTPNVAANLPGWTLTGDTDDGYSIPCFAEVPWKGVLCLQYVDPNMTTTSNSNISTNRVVVVGL